MAKVHPVSADCVNTAVEYWNSVPPTQSYMDTGKWIYVNPVGNRLNMESISFEVTGSPDEFVDLYNSYLLWDFKVRKADGLFIVPDTVTYGPINMIASTMWQTEDFYLIGERVTGVSQLANFANYAEALLGYGPSSKEQLELQGFHLDTAGSHDTTVTTPTNAAMTNSGLRNRYNRLKGDQTWKLCSRFPSELAKQPLLIPNRMDIKLILHRANAASYMMSEEEALGLKLIITSAQLKIRKMKMDPEFLVAHEMLLAKRNALIFFEEKNVLELTINAGVMSFARDDLFRGIIPKKVILALVDSAAIAGHYKKNPLKVESANLSQVGFIVNSENLPSRPLQFTPGNGFERDGYLSLLETTGLMFQNSSLLFDPDLL
ncbi:hypothetical protein RvY_02351 [Ramazzottius varieornatus]|uniref:Uncharacterized protein n=1 Tax=Ramazzottius varieornatus TaxID=947166 RepID=A0A1D1UJF2_RAMVA|nr:hypothetical protein RvY_02351 [Ramazzottius varieornatus]